MNLSLGNGFPSLSQTYRLLNRWRRRCEDKNMRVEIIVALRVYKGKRTIDTLEFLYGSRTNLLSIMEALQKEVGDYPTGFLRQVSGPREHWDPTTFDGALCSGDEDHYGRDIELSIQ